MTDVAATAGKRIGELLTRGGYVQPGDVDAALAHQERHGGKLAEILVKLGYLKPADLGKFLSNPRGLPRINLEHFTALPEVCQLIPGEYAVRKAIFPIDKLGKSLTVGMAYPLDAETIDELESMTGLRVKAVLCSPRDIRNAIRAHYPSDTTPADARAVGDGNAIAYAIKLKTIAPILDQVDHLPTLPSTVTRVREAVDDPNSSAASIAEVIEEDPAITANLLKLANSAAYAFANPVESVRQCVALMGLRETQEVVLTSAIVNVMQESKHFGYDAFWRDAVYCAGAARTIMARRSLRRNSTVFTSGLLTDIGRFAFLEAAPERYAHIDASLRGPGLLAAEEETLGVGHPEAGYLLACRWRLPESIAEAIRFHHHPKFAVESGEVASITFLAAQLTDARGDWENSVDALRERCAPVLTPLGLSAKDIGAVYKKLESEGDAD